MGITTLRYVALSSCVLFVSLMQSVNGAHFSNITCLFSLSVVVNVEVAPTPTTGIVSLISMYA